MSEQIPSGNEERDWCLYVDDMISFAGKVLVYTDGLERIQFEASGLTYDATVRNLELIGEAATHIPAPVRKYAEHIQWREIIALRNRLIHGYLGIDKEPLFTADGQIRSDVTYAQLAEFVWFVETGTGFQIPLSPPFSKGEAADKVGAGIPPFAKGVGAADKGGNRVQADALRAGGITFI